MRRGGGGVIPQCTQCIQRILDGSMPVLVFKLCVQINEKWLPKHLIYSKPKAFNFLLSVFFFQKTMKAIFMLCFNLFLLHMYSELVSSVCLIHCYSFWQFLNIFKLEAFNSRNIQECLIDLLNVNIKLSPGCFASVPQTSSSPTASQFFFVSQKMICPN